MTVKTMIVLLLTLSLSNICFSIPRDHGEDLNCDYRQESNAIKKVHEEINNNIIDTTLQKLLNQISLKSDLLIIGESHIEPTSKVALTENLETLINNNYKSLAIEMLNKPSQKTLNQFCEGKISRKKFKLSWEKDWTYRDQTENYLDLVEKACQLGVQVYAVDERNNPELKLQSNENNWRNKVMAKNINEVMRLHPKSKTIFLTGSIHGFTSPLDNSDKSTKEFVGDTSVTLELNKTHPEIKITSLNIIKKFPLMNVPIYCSYRSRIKTVKKNYPNHSSLIFSGTSTILFDYIYIDLM